MNQFKNPEAFTTNNILYGGNKAIVAGSLYSDLKIVILDGSSSLPFFKENDGICNKMLPSNWFDIRDSVIDAYCKKFNTTRDEMKLFDDYQSNVLNFLDKYIK